MTGLSRIPLGPFSLTLMAPFLAPSAADDLQHRLMAELPWRRERIRLFGREITIPRQQCWIGDPQARYRYSGLDLIPTPWPEWLQPIRTKVGDSCQRDFNSVLCNRYRSGADSMGWHSDDEPELGPAPLIAALTLGGERRFQFRHRNERRLRASIPLPHNSLLIMPPGLQAEFQHQLPKTRRAVAERINLTFRHIEPVASA